jgi:hypothetical protein
MTSVFWLSDSCRVLKQCHILPQQVQGSSSQSINMGRDTNLCCCSCYFHSGISPVQGCYRVRDPSYCEALWLRNFAKLAAQVERVWGVCLLALALKMLGGWGPRWRMKWVRKGRVSEHPFIRPQFLGWCWCQNGVILFCLQLVIEWIKHFLNLQMGTYYKVKATKDYW